MRYSTGGFKQLGKCHDENTIIDEDGKFGFAGRLFGGPWCQGSVRMILRESSKWVTPINFISLTVYCLDKLENLAAT